MNPNAFEEYAKNNVLVRGDYLASLKIQCSPNTLLNLRPIITVKGEITEWQLLISDPPHIDYVAISSRAKPTPRNPLITASAIRFHPDDVSVPIDSEKQLKEFSEKYRDLRFSDDRTSNQNPS